MGQFNFGDFAHFYIGGNTAGVLFVPTPCTRARLRRFSRWGGSLYSATPQNHRQNARGGGVCHQSRENSAETAKTPPVLPVPGGRRAAAKMPGDGDEQHRLRLLMFGPHEQSSNFKLRHYRFVDRGDRGDRGGRGDRGDRGGRGVSYCPYILSLFLSPLFLSTIEKTYIQPIQLIPKCVR